MPDKIVLEHFRADIRHMSDTEILGMIDAATFSRIRETDPHPLFKVFGIGHEGTVKGGAVGTGQKIFRYLQHAVSRLHERLSVGTKAFNRHATTNDHDGRDAIGEVVGKALREIGGALHTFAAIYIYPPFKDKLLDVASIEANGYYKLDPDGAAQVVDIADITGIALSHSSIDSPGFPGATLQGALQAFANHSQERNTTMTLEELKTAVREGKFKPADLFDKETLSSDGAVQEMIRLEKQTEYEHAKRVEKRLGEEREARLADQKAHEQEMKKTRGELVRSTQGSLFGTLAAERKLDDRQKTFVEKALTDFSTQAIDDAGVRSDLNSWIDKQLERYSAVAEIFGVKPGEGNGGKPGVGVPPAATPPPPPPPPGADLTDPKFNPLIPV